MRGIVSALFGRSPFDRSLTLSLGFCVLAAGCDSKPTAEKAESPGASAVPATVASAPQPVSNAPRPLPPTDHYAAGDRYATTPRFDPAVQPAGFGEAAQAPVAAPSQVLMLTPGLREPTEEDFIAEGGPGLSTTPSVRANPLPHSP